jgi:hypothetical protein
LAISGLCGCGDWPPVVETVSDVKRLPLAQREIRCIGCGQAEIEAVAERLRGLDYLFLNSKSSATDASIQAIATITTLRQLVIRDASRISDDGVTTLSNMPGLQELMLYDAAKLSDHGLLSLGSSRSLQKLYVSGAAAVTARAVKELQEKLPQCSVRVDAPVS